MPFTSFVAAENSFSEAQFLVGLQEGRLIVNLHDSELLESLFPVTLNDAEWYRFRMQIYPQKGIWVELLDVESGIVLGCRNLGKKTLEPIRTTRFGRRWHQFYTGCLSNVKVNNEIVDMMNLM